MIHPNLKKDKLVFQKEINFQISNLPAMNFKTGMVEHYSIFHYDVVLYKNSKNEQYYLFKHYDDCTLYIMNCNKDVYDILKKFIDINDDIEIFEHSNEDEDKGTSLEFVPIPESYRNNPGSSGTAVIFTD